MIGNEAHAQYLYSWFINNVFDRDNLAHVELRDMVEGDGLHLLHKVEPGKDDLYQVHCKQVGYMLCTVWSALQRFLEVPHVREKFCAHSQGGIYMEADIRAGKIILLRFHADTGLVGDGLARSLVNDFYKAMYGIGTEMSFPMFVMVDEYQEIADLGSSRFFDRRFFGMAREFRCSFVALTQSLAAQGAWGSDAIESLVSNCNSRGVFYSDDPRTQASVSMYDCVDLTELKPRHAFVLR